MPENKHLKALITIAYILLGFALLWVAVKYILPWFAPFILAFFTAALLNPSVNRLCERYHFRRWFASAFCTVLFLAILLAGSCLIIWRIVLEVSQLAKDLPELLSSLSVQIEIIGDKLRSYIESAPESTQEYINQAMSGILLKLSELPAYLSSKALDVASGFASAMPKTVLFLITYFISIFFIGSDYAGIKRFILRQFPKKMRRGVSDVKNDFISAMAKWFRAQMMLMGITFLELSAAFFLMRLDYAAILAAVVAIIDMLPVFGVGTVLLPWAVVAAISGDFGRAVVLLLIYCIVTLVRKFVEPKLLGNQLGLHPVATLVVIYVGFCCAGVWGMILFPFALIMLKQLNDRGYIRLWN